MAQLLSRDIQEQILNFLILNAEALRHILHRCLQFAVGTAQLLLEQGRILGIGLFYSNRMKQHFFMFKHKNTSLSKSHYFPIGKCYSRL